MDEVSWIVTTIVPQQKQYITRSYPPMDIDSLYGPTDATDKILAYNNNN